MKVAIHKVHHKLIVGVGIMIVEHQWASGPCMFLPLAVTKSDRSWLGHPQTVLDRPDEHQPDKFDIVEARVVQAANRSAIDLNVAIGQPTQIVAFAIATTLNAHVGTEWQWRSSRLVLAQFVIEIEVSDFVQLVGAQRVGALYVGVDNLTFLIVNLLEIRNAGLGNG